MFLIDLSYVQAHAGIEFERFAARSSFGISEHNADLVAQLVDKYYASIGFVTHRHYFAQRLRHQSRLNAHVAVAHLAFEFGTRS